MHYPSHLRSAFCEWVSEGMPDLATVEIDYEERQESGRDFALRFLGCTDLMPRIEMEEVIDLLDIEDEDESYGVKWDGTYHAAAYRYLRKGSAMTDREITTKAIRRVGVTEWPDLTFTEMSGEEFKELLASVRNAAQRTMARLIVSSEGDECEAEIADARNVWHTAEAALGVLMFPKYVPKMEAMGDVRALVKFYDHKMPEQVESETEPTSFKVVGGDDGLRRHLGQTGDGSDAD
jgi:hypothetical protein